MKSILAQVKQYKRDSILTPIFTALEVLMEVLLPYATALIIDQGIQQSDFNKVLLYGGLMLVMAGLSLTFGALAGKYGASASSGLACNLRQAIYDNIQRFSFSNIDKFSTAGLITRMTTDVTNVQNAYQMCLRIAVRAPLMLVSSMVMSFIISPRLSSMFLIAIFFLAVVLGLIMIFATKVFNVMFKKYDALNASIQENVSAIRVVKAYVREEHEDEKFKKASGDIYNLSVKAESLLAFNGPVMMLVIYSCIILIAWVGAQLIVGGEMSTGNLTSLFSYVMSIMMSLMMLSMIIVMITMSLASIRRISEVLDEKSDLHNPENPIEVVADGSIDFDNVDFAYKHGSGNNTLSDINLHIRSGETIGIIGGRDVREYDMEALRNQVSVVLQKNVLFSGTILDNLRWGDENATEEECIAACRAACADEFIERFPDKYNTWIEQGGTNVSGGQKQRLCIARALLKKPKILILDDSTSAVDTATDAKIRKAFAESIPGTTKIIIAQRISSVQDADRILVLDNGRINAFDTHENLLANNEIYREIYESQIKGGGDFDNTGREGA